MLHELFFAPKCSTLRPISLTFSSWNFMPSPSVNPWPAPGVSCGQQVQTTGWTATCFARGPFRRFFFAKWDGFFWGKFWGSNAWNKWGIRCQLLPFVPRIDPPKWRSQKSPLKRSRKKLPNQLLGRTDCGFKGRDVLTFSFGLETLKTFVGLRPWRNLWGWNHQKIANR